MKEKNSKDTVRIDKWLWSVRIFKSRTIAATACKSSKVQINEVNAKPSALVTIGDKLSVKKNGFTFAYKVNKIIKTRVSATLAQPCYDDLTPASELNKYKSWYSSSDVNFIREKGAGRPTKKERRDIDNVKDYLWSEEE